MPITAGNGRTSGVVWAVAVIVVLAAGVPAALWLRARTMKPPHEPYGSPIQRLNRVDNWLYRHYQLGLTDRSRVSQAVIEGRELTEPQLREAATGLADAMLAGQVGTVTRKKTWILAGTVLCMMAAAIVAAIVTGRYAMLDAVCWLPLLFVAVKLSKRTRERVARARQLNDGPGRATSVPEQPGNDGH